MNFWILRRSHKRVRVVRMTTIANLGSSSLARVARMELVSRTPSSPFRFSPSATNLAINAGSSLYPSHCAASMLKDMSGDYDVIVLEFQPTKLYYPDTNEIRRAPSATISKCFNYLFGNVASSQFFKCGSVPQVVGQATS